VISTAYTRENWLPEGFSIIKKEQIWVKPENPLKRHLRDPLVWGKRLNSSRGQEPAVLPKCTIHPICFSSIFQVSLFLLCRYSPRRSRSGRSSSLITLVASTDVTASLLNPGSYQSIVDFVGLHSESGLMSEEEILSIWTKSLIMVKRNPKGGKWKDELDPKAIIYRKSGGDRRKRDDPSYEGPERRLGTL
jgi:hypothetical protein